MIRQVPRSRSRSRPCWLSHYSPSTPTSPAPPPPPSPLSTLQETEAKIAARQAVVAGPLKDKFGKLVGLLTAAGGKFMTGDQATYAE